MRMPSLATCTARGLLIGMHTRFLSSGDGTSKKTHPHGESNPGRLGENQKSLNH